MSSPFVLVLNAAAQSDRFASFASRLQVEVRHASWDVPWEEIAARRAGKKVAPREVPAELRELLARAEVIFGFALPVGLSELAPKLRWVETPATGFDQLRGTGVLENPKVHVTTFGGLFASVVAEHALALLLSKWKRLPEFDAHKARREWKPATVRELRESTVGIVGLGNIGRAMARAVKAFGARVVATGRNAIPELVDKLYPRSELKTMLAESDAVVLSVSGTPATVKLIGEAELSAMKPDAYLINVSRGFVVDEAALVKHLQAGRLAGAALDVFEHEPLPAESALWTLPNVTLTPHVAITVASRLPRAVAHFGANLTRFVAGEPLMDEIDAAARQ